MGIVLGAIIAVELRAGTSEPRYAEAVPTPTTAISASAATDPAPIDAWVATIMARPVFDPARAPAAATGAPATALPRLAGIMITPGLKDAVFAPAAGPTVIATEGGRVGPYTIMEIGRETVLVEGPHGLAVLHTSFASGGARTTAAPVASPFSVVDGITGTPGGIWLDDGGTDLPNASTWPGPPPLLGLPVQGNAGAIGGPSLLPPGS